MNDRYAKNNPDDSIWWLSTPETTGEFVFSFDKKKNYNLFRDYPEKLTAEEKRIFDRENPEWAEFFKDRE